MFISSLPLPSLYIINTNITSLITENNSQYIYQISILNMTFINSAESLQSHAESSLNNLHQTVVGLCIYATAALQGIQVLCL